MILHAGLSLHRPARMADVPGCNDASRADKYGLVTSPLTRPRILMGGPPAPIQCLKSRARAGKMPGAEERGIMADWKDPFSPKSIIGNERIHAGFLAAKRWDVGQSAPYFFGLPSRPAGFLHLLASVGYPVGRAIF